jgi:hypothetical protein
MAFNDDIKKKWFIIYISDIMNYDLTLADSHKEK